jgi:hypothetical protein
MITIHFRLVSAGSLEAPVRVFPVTQDGGALIFHEGEFSEPLHTSKSLEDLTVNELPDWLLRQRLPLSLTPPQHVSAPDAAAAWRAMYEAASAAYLPRLEPVEATHAA